MCISENLILLNIENKTTSAYHFKLRLILLKLNKKQLKPYAYKVGQINLLTLVRELKSFAYKVGKINLNLVHDSTNSKFLPYQIKIQVIF